MSADLDTRVRALVARFATLPLTGDDVPLAGRGGLGFDSVRLVELLLACEAELGVALPVERVLAGPPLTVAGLVAQVRQLAAPGGAA